MNSSLKTPLKLALFGQGKMGTLVKQLAETRGHIIASSLDHCDLIIDFTKAESVIDNVKKACDAGKNIVIGTTGWLNQLPQVRKLIESSKIGALYSPNFSLGVLLFIKIVEEAAKRLSQTNIYDVAGNEFHHRQKQDSPSGTAQAIASTLLNNWPEKTHPLYDTPQGKIDEKALHFQSVRVGHIPGTHSVYFDSPHDTITLTHAAKGREGFAHGAVMAAEWLHGKKGFFTMEDYFQ